ncbi:MAG: hypothetical protein KDA89_25355 [Planctomycetaceae bacterium]|nr:hypothetical protein [Planctomycetaceae bacterium]
MERCMRCGRRLRNDKSGWNAVLVDGVVTGIVCPRCQSPEENAEAEINDGTIEYSTDDDGLHRGSPKGVS